MSAHEEFRELCALATSASLTGEERSRLETHLESCTECRQAAREYETVARVGLPSLVSDFPAEPSPIPGRWSEERAYQEFLERLEQGSPRPEETCEAGSCAQPGEAARRIAKRPWKTRWWPQGVGELLPYAAGVAVALIVGLLGYELGAKRTADFAVVSEQQSEEVATAARNQIALLSRERESLQARGQERDRELDRLRRQMAQKSAEVQKLNGEGQTLRDSLQRSEVEKSETTSERDALNHRLGQVQSDRERLEADLALKQKDLDALRQQRASDARRATELEARAEQLVELLKDRNNALDQQQELLAHDRDIRDLMGARDLYIAEVFDVGRSGKTKKPFGRVFFTKGKSLIFYAYDLDQQPGLRNASSFQAWGRRGPDLSQAASLGIFYVDSSAHKRWVVKFSDPKLIQQIDAVFVTVEPKGGSPKPSGKQLLFAYLRVEPNHP